MAKKRDDMILSAKAGISGEEMMVLEGIMLVNASEKKHKVFKKQNSFDMLICNN